MRKRKFNKQLLNEEIKKFKMMSEYRFISDETIYGKPSEDEDLILGNLSEEEDEEAPAEEGGDLDMDALAGDVKDDMAPEEGGEEAPAEEPSLEDEPAEEPSLDEPMEEPLDMEEPAGDEVELDVTELVTATDEAKASADMANDKISQLMDMVGKLEGQLQSMTDISQKIDNLETELEKRAPTPEEKIEMRSLDSYPYNLKLTDFWSQQEGQYDIMNKEDKPKEYVLDKDAIESDYSEADVKDSFDNPFTEEEI